MRWRPIPIALGACVLVAVQAHRTWKQEKKRYIDENGQPVRTKGPWSVSVPHSAVTHVQVYILGALPLNAISRAWGYLNDLTLPVWIRPYGFRLYAWLFGCNLDEMRDSDLTNYENLAQFFSRELAPGARPIAESLVVSPADGKVLHLGEIDGHRVEQVKGLTYSLDTLLGYGAKAQSVEQVGQDTDSSVADHEHFADVNGIEYSLGRLLGSEGTKRHSVRAYLGGWFSGAWRWTKRQFSWGDKSRHIDPVHAPKSSAEVPQDDEGLECDDASIETPDSPEIFSRYANVAYKMGSEAIPLFSQSRPLTQKDHKLFFCVVYLAPGDYHRFHSPVSWVVEMRRHFRGELYSVSPYVAKRLPNLFLLNERVALLGRWQYGFFGMVPIGATNVGSIRINFDRELRTNVQGHRKLMGTFSEATFRAASRILGGQPLAAGDEMGGFLLGSTIVLVFEAPESFKFNVHAGEKVRVGQSLGDVPADGGS